MSTRAATTFKMEASSNVEKFRPDSSSKFILFGGRTSLGSGQGFWSFGLQLIRNRLEDQAKSSGLIQARGKF